jgi:hypothetical protein
MGRDDYGYDDDRRPRRRPWRDDDYRDRYSSPPRRPRSGAVTSAAVLNLVIAPLVLLFTMCFGACFVISPATEAIFVGIPGGLGENTTVTVMVMAAVFVWGALAFVTGVGLLCRARWSRILGLIMGGSAFPIGLLYLTIAMLFMVAADANEDRAGNILFPLIRSGFFLGYGTWTYVVLLNPRRIDEFRSDD